MIRIRECVLDAFFKTGMKTVLNGGECNNAAPRDIPQQIAECVLELKKSTIIQDDGVDYEGIKNSKTYKQFKENTAGCLRNFDPGTLTAPEEKLAFWINLYNLLTIDAVLQYGVRRSVTEGWLGVIRFFRQAAYMIERLRYSLEDIEHGILRVNRGVPFFPGKHFSDDDPRRAHVVTDFDDRIHFALNCASKSCPPVAYYTPDRIHAQLDLSAANFIDGETKLDKSGVLLRVSRIFKWYKKDFDGKSGVLRTIRRYLPESDMRRKLIENFGESTMMEYIPYDWHLNVLA